MSAKSLWVDNQSGSNANVIPIGGGSLIFEVPEGDTFGLVQVFPVPGGPAYTGLIAALEGSSDPIFGPATPPLPINITGLTSIENLFGIRTDDGFTQDVNGPLPYTT